MGQGDSPTNVMHVTDAAAAAQLAAVVAALGAGDTSTTASGNITTQNLAPTGVATANSAVEYDVAGRDTAIIQISGVYTGTLGLAGTVDGTTWSVIIGPVFNLSNTVLGLNFGAAGVGQFLAVITGFSKIRVYGTNAITGTAAVYIRGADDNAGVHVLSAPVQGITTIGTSVTPGTSAAHLGKAEDAVAASGDTGVAIFGVRVPTTPAAPTSAAGDYSSLALSAEGKQVIAGRGAEEHTWQGIATANASTADIALKASAGAGLRNYLTDIIISNTSATPTTVNIKDGSTIIMGPINVPAGAVVVIDLSTALRGTAATALNIASTVSVTSIVVSGTGYIGV